MSSEERNGGTGGTRGLVLRILPRFRGRACRMKDSALRSLVRNNQSAEDKALRGPRSSVPYCAKPQTLSGIRCPDMALDRIS